MTISVKQQPQLDTQEAFNLWDMLKTRYDWMEQTNILKNFIHDKDLTLMVTAAIGKPIEKQITELESMMNQLKIKLPRRPPKSARIPVTVEAINDRYIMKIFMTQLQENLDMHLRAIQTTLTNESIRSMFRKFLNAEIMVYDKAIKYSNFKGWIESPPNFPMSPPGVAEKINRRNIPSL